MRVFFVPHFLSGYTHFKLQGTKKRLEASFCYLVTM